MSPKVTFVTRLFTQPPHRLGPIMPSANDRRCYNSDSGEDEDSGEEEAEQERSTGQFSLSRIHVHGISSRKRVQRGQRANDIGNPSWETPPPQAWR